MSTELWIESRELTGLLVGPQVCEDNPCDTHEAEACGDLLIEYREVLNAGAWLDPEGEWVLLECCGGGGDTIEQDCCPGVNLPASMRTIVTLSGSASIYSADFNGSYWVVTESPSQFSLRCNEGVWEVGRNEGGTIVWYTADGRCDPDFFQGVTLEDGTSISFVATFDDAEDPPCEVWGYAQDLYLPDWIQIDDAACAEALADCFCGENVVDVPCVVACPFLPRFILMDLEFDPSFVCGTHSYALLNGTYLLTAEFDGSEWYWLAQSFAEDPDANNGVGFLMKWSCTSQCYSGEGEVPILGLVPNSFLACVIGGNPTGSTTIACDSSLGRTFTLIEQQCDPFRMVVDYLGIVRITLRKA